VKKLRQFIEDVAANCIGGGEIMGFDPVLFRAPLTRKNKKKKREGDAEQKGRRLPRS
jgi:hypothetical protein